MNGTGQKMGGGAAPFPSPSLARPRSPASDGEGVEIIEILNFPAVSRAATSGMWVENNSVYVHRSLGAPCIAFKMQWDERVDGGIEEGPTRALGAGSRVVATVREISSVGGLRSIS